LVLIAVSFSMGVCVSAFDRGILGGDVAVVKIDGTIMTADSAVEDLENARKDSGIKAVVLRIDSPGGAVAASQEIFEEVRRVNAVKPVVASMGDLGASGGYYIACGARKIFANPATITGSIGVRMEHVNLKDLLSWAKVEHQTLKSGEMKDVGTFDRPMTPEEKAFFEGILRTMHEQFKAAVAQSRNIPIDKVNEFADGRIITGEEALNLGLVDEIGGLTVAVKSAAEMAGIKGEPETIYFEKAEPWWMSLFLNSARLVLQHADKMLAMYRM
jgi:protease-4